MTQRKIRITFLPAAVSSFCTNHGLKKKNGHDYYLTAVFKWFSVWQLSYNSGTRWILLSLRNGRNFIVKSLLPIFWTFFEKMVKKGNPFKVEKQPFFSIVFQLKVTDIFVYKKKNPSFPLSFSWKVPLFCFKDCYFEDKYYFFNIF